MKKIVALWSLFLITSLNSFAMNACKDIVIEKGQNIIEYKEENIFLILASFEVDNDHNVDDYRRTKESVNLAIFAGTMFPKITRLELIVDKLCLLKAYMSDELVGEFEISLHETNEDIYKLTSYIKSANGEDDIILNFELISGTTKDQRISKLMERRRIQEENKRVEEERQRQREEELKKLKSITISSFCKKSSYSSRKQTECSDKLSGYEVDERALHVCLSPSSFSMKMKCAEMIIGKEYSAERIHYCSKAGSKHSCFRRER